MFAPGRSVGSRRYISLAAGSRAPAPERRARATRAPCQAGPDLVEGLPEPQRRLRDILQLDLQDGVP